MAVEKQTTEADLEEDWLIPVVELTYEEAFAVLDKQARRRLNMSGNEFLHKWTTNAFSQEFKAEHHSAFAALSILVAPFVD
jgi:hypothetical protein